MSLPNPITRKEEYLNAIATGGTDYPANPITREEAYLDAIAKSGGGGVSGVTSVNGKTGVVTLDASDVGVTGLSQAELNTLGGLI